MTTLDCLAKHVNGISWPPRSVGRKKRQPQPTIPWRELLEERDSKKSELAKRLIGFRKQTWLNVEEIAAITGISTKTLNRLETDDSDLKQKDAIALARVYGRESADFDVTKDPPDLPRRPVSAFFVIVRPDMIGSEAAQRVSEEVRKGNAEAARGRPTKPLHGR